VKYYIIAGEASGDLHASNLIRQINLQDPTAEIRAWGGDEMTKAGANVVKHIRDLAFMGFIEVVMNIRAIFKNISWCKSDISSFQPDALILVDYPGFNLRIAKWAHEKGLKVIYYISPQLWAWHESRVKEIRQNVDLMMVILPFEKEFYAKHAMEVTFVGHPLLDIIAPEKTSNQQNSNRKTIALLPGSRKQEIIAMLPVMLSVAEEYPMYDWVLACAPAIPDSFYYGIVAKNSAVRLVRARTYELLTESFVALVTSGTATLETALFGVPQVVCYKGNKVSYWLAKRLIKVKYISLVNLILDKALVTELIQGEMNHDTLKTEFEKLLNPKRRSELEIEYQILRNQLGNAGASKRAAEAISDFMKL